jgi:hypothetical protein
MYRRGSWTLTSILITLVLITVDVGSIASLSINRVQKLGSFTFSAIWATIDFEPDVLNLKSKGESVTVYIELPPCYNVSDIVISSIKLNGMVTAELHPTRVGDYDGDGIPDLMVKFDRSSVQSILKPGNQTITVTGTILGVIPDFIGTDTIKVIDDE